MFIPTTLNVRYLGFNTASGVSLSATASPGTTIVSLPVVVSLNTLNVIVYTQATVNYVYGNLALGSYTIGNAGYGGSLTASYEEITIMVVNYP